jgi:guanylate kinase
LTIPLPRLQDPAFPIVVSGPSGVGKTVLCRRLCQSLPWTALTVTATTRAPRGDEKHGVSYLFYDETRFREERDQGRLVEWAEVHGYLYGSPRVWLDQKLREGTSPVLNIDVQGGLHVKEAYPQSVLVFVLPPSWSALEARLRARGTESPEAIRRRLDTAERELQVLPKYEYVLVNDGLEEAAAELISIVRAERARLSRRLPG